MPTMPMSPEDQKAPKIVLDRGHAPGSRPGGVQCMPLGRRYLNRTIRFVIAPEAVASREK